MAWVALILGGLFEVGFTTCLRFVEGFRNLWWTGGFMCSATASVILLDYASRSIPLGTAYAIWAGIGAVGTLVVGIAFFGEPTSFPRIFLVLTIVAAIAGLKLVR